ncbi:MAG: hypothetical protein D6819_04185 [Gammaproteobacteria bacterium]|nr:MAG: hypothetical protein D6819_04185 [Gammaproteobacteria bacterium]
MKKLAMVCMLALFGAGLAYGETLAELAAKIRSGEVDAGEKHSMEIGARFHTIHNQLLGMRCGTCHVPRYAKDYLFLSRYEVPRRFAPGVVGRATCIGCHQEGGIATPWYGTAAD